MPPSRALCLAALLTLSLALTLAPAHAEIGAVHQPWPADRQSAVVQVEWDGQGELLLVANDDNGNVRQTARTQRRGPGASWLYGRHNSTYGMQTRWQVVQRIGRRTVARAELPNSLLIRSIQPVLVTDRRVDRAKTRVAFAAAWSVREDRRGEGEGVEGSDGPPRLLSSPEQLPPDLAGWPRDAGYYGPSSALERASLVVIDAPGLDGRPELQHTLLRLVRQGACLALTSAAGVTPGRGELGQVLAREFTTVATPAGTPALSRRAEGLGWLLKVAGRAPDHPLYWQQAALSTRFGDLVTPARSDWTPTRQVRAMDPRRPLPAHLLGLYLLGYALFLVGLQMLVARRCTSPARAWLVAPLTAAAFVGVATLFVAGQGCRTTEARQCTVVHADAGQRAAIVSTALRISVPRGTRAALDVGDLMPVSADARQDSPLTTDERGVVAPLPLTLGARTSTTVSGTGVVDLGGSISLDLAYRGSFPVGRVSNNTPYRLRSLQLVADRRDGSPRQPDRTYATAIADLGPGAVATLTEQQAWRSVDRDSWPVAYAAGVTEAPTATSRRTPRRSMYDETYGERKTLADYEVVHLYAVVDELGPALALAPAPAQWQKRTVLVLAGRAAVSGQTASCDLTKGATRWLVSEDQTGWRAAAAHVLEPVWADGWRPRYLQVREAKDGTVVWNARAAAWQPLPPGGRLSPAADFLSNGQVVLAGDWGKPTAKPSDGPPSDTPSSDSARITAFLENRHGQR